MITSPWRSPVDDKNRNEEFARKVLLKPIIYKLMIYIILVGGTPL
jgi:hypothetical protein